MKTITKAEFLDLYENDRVYDILVTPIAILGKVKRLDTDPPVPKPEIVVVNLP